MADRELGTTPAGVEVGVEDGGRRRGPARSWHVRVESTVPETEIEQFWDLYQQAFGPLRTKAAARQVLTRAEFGAELVDPRVEKHVARGRHGELLGMTTFTRHLSTVPWISPEYFAARYPEQAERDAIFYLGFTLVRPGMRGVSVFADMIRSCLAVLIEARGVCGYDVCGYNDDVLRMETMIRHAVADHTELQHVSVDRQTYYCVVV